MAQGGCAHAYNTMKGSPLYFFYDCEATNGDIENDRIIEIAAVLYTKNLEHRLQHGKITELVCSNDHYQSLCYCTRAINPVVAPLIHLTLADLRNQPSIATVLDGFFEWIVEKVHHVEMLTHNTYTPVLVAHSGNRLDYPLLLAELDRIGKPSLITIRITQSPLC